ncbi:hypothetical protein WA026_017309 [Henosepilachna vigintioctopunctata]|uniref:Uncharacterized protein n=1 Tax=Henosepilachna vigintioctopunctata TaxID=420089 RepID=A0AAW1UMR0_9CUCU
MCLKKESRLQRFSSMSPSNRNDNIESEWASHATPKERWSKLTPGLAAIADAIQFLEDTILALYADDKAIIAVPCDQILQHGVDKLQEWFASYCITSPVLTTTPTRGRTPSIRPTNTLDGQSDILGIYHRRRRTWRAHIYQCTGRVSCIR